MLSENKKSWAKSEATVYTTKDKIVDIFREAGYDFITASEIADETIREFKTSGKKRQRYYLKNGVSFVIQKKEANKRSESMTRETAKKVLESFIGRTFLDPVKGILLRVDSVDLESGPNTVFCCVAHHDLAGTTTYLRSAADTGRKRLQAAADVWFA